MHSTFQGNVEQRKTTIATWDLHVGSNQYFNFVANRYTRHSASHRDVNTWLYRCCTLLVTSLDITFHNFQHGDLFVFIIFLYIPYSKPCKSSFL